MSKSIKSVYAGVLFLTCLSLKAHSADMDVSMSREGVVYAILDGEIKANDGKRFDYIIDTWKRKGHTPEMLFINSPGGDVYESYVITKTVLDNGMATVVLKNDHCESACVAILAAGRVKKIDPNSHIGVHRASTGGEDSNRARAASITMVQIYKLLNIPESIRLKMVETDPGEMYYLTQKEKSALEQSQSDLTLAKEATRTTNAPVTRYTVPPVDRKRASEYNAQGIIFIQHHDYPNAITILDEANQLSPADAEVLGNLGYAYYMNRQYYEAQYTLTASLALKPNRGSSWNNLGLTVAALGDVDWATECFIKYWQFSKNKKAATNQFFYWEEKRPGTALDKASKRARSALRLYSPVP